MNVLNSTALHATWTPPKQQFINGKNFGYKVLAITLDGEPSKAMTIVPHDPTNDLQQTSLLKYGLYFVVYSKVVVAFYDK